MRIRRAGSLGLKIEAEREHSSREPGLREANDEPNGVERVVLAVLGRPLKRDHVEYSQTIALRTFSGAHTSVDVRFP